MEELKVDIFIPIVIWHIKKFPASLYSALSQTYRNIRIILFSDGVDPDLEALYDKWWYEPEDNPREMWTEMTFPRIRLPLAIEACKKGYLIRNPAGPMGSGAVARQWIFEWPEKRPLVKFLDCDDILAPDAIEIMLRYLTADCDGVLCPLARASSCRFVEVISGRFELGHMGSGSLLMRKESMEHMVQQGFEWPNKQGHDKEFIKFCLEHGYKFNRVTKENFLYSYLKSPG
jgi:glycosyltransferase involved in cell wall biosynthesis